MVKDEDWCIQYETEVLRKRIFKQHHCRECMRLIKNVTKEAKVVSELT